MGSSSFTSNWTWVPYIGNTESDTGEPGQHQSWFFFFNDIQHIFNKCLYQILGLVNKHLPCAVSWALSPCEAGVIPSTLLTGKWVLERLANKFALYIWILASELSSALLKAMVNSTLRSGMLTWTLSSTFNSCIAPSSLLTLDYWSFLEASSCLSPFPNPSWLWASHSDPNHHWFGK